VLAGTPYQLYRFDASFGVWEPVLRRLIGGVAPSIWMQGDDTIVAIIEARRIRSIDDGRTWDTLDNPDGIVSAATDDGGAVVLFGLRGRSTDLGATWTPTSIAPTSRFTNVGGGRIVSVGDHISVSRDTGRTWTTRYVVSGNRALARHAAMVVVANGATVYVSIDSGTTWRQHAAPVATHLSTTPSGEILLASWSELPQASNGIHRSSDSGRTWTQISGGDVRATVASRDGVIWGAAMSGAFSSDDDGRTWRQRNDGFNERTAALSSDRSGAFLAVSPVPTLRTFNHAELFRSDDDGMSWKRILDSVVSAIPLFDGGGIVATTNPGYDDRGLRNDAFATRVSTDRGATWQLVANGSMSFAAARGPHGAFLASGAPGPNLYVSSDGGGTWSAATAPGTGRMAVTPSGRILITTQVQGPSAFEPVIIASDDRGRTWDRIYDGPWVVGIAALTDSIYLAATYDTLLRTTDAGATWSARPIGTFMNEIHLFDGVVLIPAAYDRSKTLLERSTDMGATWTRDSLGSLGPRSMRPIFSPTTGELFALRDDGLDRSTDFGASWQRIDTATWITSLASNGRAIVASTSSSGLYRTTSLSSAPREGVHHRAAPLRIRPLPARRRVVVDPPVRGELRIVDLTGRLVHTQHVDGVASIVVDVSAIVSGLYIVQLDVETTRHVGRMVIARE
jgi:hypothetical protein